MNLEDRLDSRLAKLASLGIAAACLWLVSAGGVEAMARTAGLLIFTLAFIWFGKYLEHYRGWAHFRLVTQATPALLLQVMGWVLLLLYFAISLRSSWQ